MLGLVSNGKRNIQSGSEYDRYFRSSKVTGKETELLSDGDVYDTLKLMRKMVNNTLDQTREISKVLKAKDKRETCRRIWSFLYNNVQYKKDHPMREQLRTPARTWRDRKTGVDCDCYSVFIASVLTNLKIAHNFRMAGYNGKDFQHVYVVVPVGKKPTDQRTSYLVIDPVVDAFNYETPYSKKFDENIDMATITQLDGLYGCDSKTEREKVRRFVDTSQIIAVGQVPTEQFLKENKVPYRPVFQNNQSFYAVMTADGEKLAPTILTKEQSLALLADVNAKPTTPTATDKQMASFVPTDLKKVNWWVVVAIVGGVALLSSRGERKTDGLSGTPKKSRKAKAVKRKAVRQFKI